MYICISYDLQGYRMRDGDYIKLGRVRFRIREILCQGQDSKNTVIPYLYIYKSQISKQVSVVIQSHDKGKIMTQEDNDDDAKSRVSSSEVICRICLGGSETGNPLVDACKC